MAVSSKTPCFAPPPLPPGPAANSLAWKPDRIPNLKLGPLAIYSRAASARRYGGGPVPFSWKPAAAFNCTASFVPGWKPNRPDNIAPQPGTAAE